MPKKTLPVLPLRDIVVFPDMVAPLFVGRDKSVAALEMVDEGENEIMLVAQKDPSTDEAMMFMPSGPLRRSCSS